MSEGTDSSTEPIYVRLLDEGTIVYRPAGGIAKGAGLVQLVAPSDHDPDDEHWEFEPGTTVGVQARTLEGKQVLVAVSVAE